jgi:hypothetical protein
MAHGYLSNRAFDWMLSQQELEDLVRKAILLYNRVRSPEATAKLVLVSTVSVTVLFSGGFCYDCGILDIVEGFADQFKAITDKAELKVGKTRQINPRTFQADYNIKTK